MKKLTTQDVFVTAVDALESIALAGVAWTPDIERVKMLAENALNRIEIMLDRILEQERAEKE